MFGKLFDFNNDGKLDACERAMELGFIMEMTKDNSEEKSSSVSSGFEDTEIEEDELTAAGLDYDELEFMDEDERIEALEDAGLDPDDYDF